MIAEMYTKYRSPLLKYCYRICGNKADAEDLLQETFTKALSSLDLLETLNEHQRMAWLYKVARNLFYDKCRKASVEKAHFSDLLPEEETAGGFDKVDTAIVLSALPPDLSGIFIKRYFLGYTSKELSEEYGLSASGIRAALKRAREILRKQIE